MKPPVWRVWWWPVGEKTTELPPVDVQQILGEIKSMMGFVPPALGAVAADPAALRAAWWATRCGYLENPLSALFKEQFMAIIARYQLSPYSLIVRSCSLRRMGMSPHEVVAFLKSKVPPQGLIIERMRLETATWRSESGWAKLPKAAEQWILWATVRLAMRRDPAGRCRLALREVLGEVLFNKVVMLATFAAMQRVWIDSHPDIDPTGDERVQEEYRRLLAQAPEFSGVWDALVRRAARRKVTPRERNLMAEIARQDEARQKLRDSETRFRRVVQNAAFPVMIYAQDGEVIMLNHAWRSLSGWTRKRIPNVQTWMRRAQVDQADWSPEDMDALDGWHEAIEEGEQRILTRSGQVRRWDFATSALGKLADGRNAFMRMAVDVTERRDLESALRVAHERVTRILESITDAFIATDSERRITWMNSEAARMFGCDRDAMIGRTFHEAFPAVAGTALYEKVTRCMEERQTLHFETFSNLLNLPLEMHAYGSDEGLTLYFHDITDRKQMESALRLANQNLTGVLSSITDGFVALDREHRVTWMNQKAADMLRIDRAAAMGKPLEQVLPPKASADVTRQMMKCMEEGGSIHIEYYSQAIEASIEMNAYSWEGGLAVHFRDISERKRMEEALRDSERKFRGLFESDMVGIMFADRFSGRISECNDALLRIIGYDRDDLRNGHLNWRELTPAEWRQTDAQAVQELGKHALVPYEKEYIHKDGHRVPILLGAAPVAADEAVVMAFVIDRTRARSAEKREEDVHRLLDAVLQATPIAINALDLQGRIIMWNQAAVELYGWTLEEVRGGPLPMVLDEDRESYQKVLERRLAGEPVSVSGVRCRRKDGRIIQVDVETRPVRDGAGKLIALMTAGRPTGRGPQESGRGHS